MDQHLLKITQEKVTRLISSLEKNNMRGYYVQNEIELKQVLAKLMPDASSVAVGGSMTLFETGTLEWIRQNNYHFYDRYAQGLTADEIKEVHRKAFSVDTYLCSVNAITEKGELYNVDGSGNRVAAMIYGPDRVIVIAGTNKIVKDIDDAITRNREISAPANAVRLNMGTPCTITGSCSDCKSTGRICCAYTTIAYQRNKDRIHVIFVQGSYGY